jgi:hypothetical protein
MAGHDLRLVIRRFDVGVGGADQASDVAAIGEVDGIIAAGVAEGIAGVDYIGVVEEDPGVAVRVRVVDVIPTLPRVPHYGPLGELGRRSGLL